MWKNKVSKHFKLENGYKYTSRIIFLKPVFCYSAQWMGFPQVPANSLMVCSSTRRRRVLAGSKTLLRLGHLKQGVYIIRWDFNEGFLFHVAHRINLPLKSSNLDNFEHIHKYLHSSRFWPTVMNRATNNQAYQSCINTACTVPNRSACSKDGWPWRGTEECSLYGVSWN
jgi:hypothetical protein